MRITITPTLTSPDDNNCQTVQTLHLLFATASEIMGLTDSVCIANALLPDCVLAKRQKKHRKSRKSKNSRKHNRKHRRRRSSSSNNITNNNSMEWSIEEIQIQQSELQKQLEFLNQFENVRDPTKLLKHRNYISLHLNIVTYSPFLH